MDSNRLYEHPLKDIALSDTEAAIPIESTDLLFEIIERINKGVEEVV